jgi:hypothetical protein
MMCLVIVTKRDEIERSLQQGCSVQGQKLEHDYHSVIFSCPLKLEGQKRALEDVPIVPVSSYPTTKRILK